MEVQADFPELGEDQVDRTVAPSRDSRWLPRRRLALGSRESATPAWTFVLVGVALGPAGVGVLTTRVVNEAQGAAWVALAVLGVFVGLTFARGNGDRTSIGLAGPAAAVLSVTILTIGAGAWWLMSQQPSRFGGGVLVAALTAVCLSMSAAPLSRPGSGAGAKRATALADLDDMPVILLGTLAITLIAGADAWTRLLATAAAGGAIGLSGWLLFERADATERGLFMTGIVLLLAGVGSYLGTSPLFSGCLAGIVLVRVPGVADRVTARDLRVLHHPMLALLLILAGAAISWTGPVVWFAAGLFVLRTIAKIIASFAAAGAIGVPAGTLASILLPPGMVGIALAINLSLLTGETYAWLVSSVTIATVLSDALALFLPDDAEAQA